MSRVWVVGSINADTILRVAHLPGPGETTPGELSTGLGGKGANQAIGAARAGAEVAFVGAVGDDRAAVDARATMGAEGVDTGHVLQLAGPTGAAFVMVEDSGENSIVVVAGANGALGPAEAGDVVVTQGELPLATTLAALESAHAAGAHTIWNPAPAAAEVARHLAPIDVVIVNEIELAMLVGDGPVPEGVTELHRLGATAAIATLGPDGVVAWREGTVTTRPAVAAEVVDTTGAGDCFVGVLAAGLAAGDTLDDAIGRAIIAAGLAVARPGTAMSMPSAAEIACGRLDP